MEKLAKTLKDTQVKIEQKKQDKAKTFFNKTLKPLLKKYAIENSNSNHYRVNSKVEPDIFDEISEHMDYLEDIFKKEGLKVEDCEFPAGPGYEISW